MTLTETLPNTTPSLGEHSTGPTTCYIHPNVETSLRCNKCNRYICAKCAVRTPVGYRCKQCIYQQQDIFFTAIPRDYAVAAVASGVLGGAIGFILAQSLFLALILGAPAGALIGEVVWRLTGKRRGRYISYACVTGIVVGTLIAILPMIQSLIASPYDMDTSSLLGQVDTPSVPLIAAAVLAAPVLYVVLCSLITYLRFRVKL